MSGVMLRHDTARSRLVLVPILSKPLLEDSPGVCPGCQTYHGCKTVHLVVDDAGRVMVSHGVLEDLKLAGLPNLTVENEVAEPPPLYLGGTAPWYEQRQANDHANRALNGLRRS